MRKVFLVAVGIALGWAIGKAFNQTNLGMGLGALFGVAAAVYEAGHR